MADAAKYLGVAQKTLAVYHRAALDILIKAANSMKMRLCHLTPRALASWTETSFWKELPSALPKTMPRLWLKLLLLLKKFVIHSPRCVNRWDLCVSMCLWGWNRRAKMCMLDLLLFTHPWDF